ncbi:Prokaryotic ATPase [Indibacter alkaliphilus LW1]|uniref:Prokaryotic ATPase n=1 Tax=Indibacter alkaliphilus (strain CCUG 57479 / KCTC 22604 / LW1) TaxID=1189612 RepID=S2D8Y3_INDAL|nr:hypothetical protein [Indibacter alkaliphilus]EOZ93490.1 Prokaryotic ATPase [Indibacter alkaliphilus LW1]
MSPNQNQSINRNFRPNFSIWRTHDKAEIDYLEETDGMLYAYEFKWKDQKVRFPASFLQTYPEHQAAAFSKKDFEGF